MQKTRQPGVNLRKRKSLSIYGGHRRERASASKKLKSKSRKALGELSNRPLKSLPGQEKSEKKISSSTKSNSDYSKFEINYNARQDVISSTRNGREINPTESQRSISDTKLKQTESAFSEESDIECELSYPLPGRTPDLHSDSDDDDALHDSKSIIQLASTLLAPSVGCVTPEKLSKNRKNCESDSEELLELTGSMFADSPDLSLTSVQFSDVELSPIHLELFGDQETLF
eukprot:30315_1